MLRYYPDPRTMIHPELSRRIQGGLSDHALRCYRICIIAPINQTLFAVSGITYNLMMKCAGLEYGRSGNGSPFANNPFLISESDEQYVARKVLQINQVLHLIFARKFDFAFLQEADFFSNQTQDSVWLKHHKQWLQHEFTSALANKHYAIIYHPRTHEYNQDLVTVYLTTAFNLNTHASHQPILLSEHSHRYRALQCFLTHIPSGNPISLINMHLHYEDNYVDNQKLGNALSAHYMITLMGGDANHCPGADMPYLFNDETPTTICYDKDHQGNPLMINNNSVLSLQNPQRKATAYDGICVYAPVLYYAKLQSCGGETFTLQSNGTVSVKFSDLQRNRIQNQSLPGSPYRNEKYEIREIDTKLGLANQTLAQKNIYAAMISALLMEREMRKVKAPTKLLGSLHHYRQFMDVQKQDQGVTILNQNSNLSNNEKNTLS